MKKITSFICLLSVSLTTSFAQTTQPFGVQAESGTLGSDFGTAITSGITYVYPKTDYASTTSPGNDTKVISYSITFPEAGTYDLYVKLYVGVDGVSDDSFYTPRSVGSKTSSDSNDWVNINGLNVSGNTLGSETVTGDNMGSSILQQWKWVNVSQYYNTGTKWTYIVAPGALTVPFQIGARENGLWIDKLVFGKTGTSYTVNQLEGATLSTKKHNDFASTVTIYPNPSSTQFTINSSENAISYSIYNILGAKVEEGIFVSGTTNYGGDLKSGVYILDMNANNKRSVTKLIKL